ncbi:MAG: hypothetical protein WCK78_04280 [Paludibacter sp.]
METGLKLTKISVEEMLLRKEQAYNPKVWKQAIQRYSEYPKCQFYLIEPEKNYSYTRFFVSYVCQGIYFFSDFSAFSACLSNNGFCEVSIDEEGNVYKYLFTGANGKTGYAENTRENRAQFRRMNSAIEKGFMVCNSL